MEKQQVELKNLQLQIRPHFLINAFNLIYTLAQDKESEHIQQIMLYLSDYFRYIFRSDRSLELFGKELKLIEGYINMAQIRYPGSIEIVYDISPEIAYVRIPPLLLHNFIENIIKHVVNQGAVTHILMKGTYANGKVAFLVKDDGPGMAPEKLVEVMKKNEAERNHRNKCRTCQCIFVFLLKLEREQRWKWYFIVTLLRKND